ncbi:MAG: ATP-binding protein [Anaerovoracaceae bacterium]
MYINRHIESVVNRISKRKPIIVLTGARQVGKSTMFREMYDDINYIALSNPRILENAKSDSSIFFDRNKPPIIVDEIQKAGELFDYIKDIVDEQKLKGQFFLSGSQSLRLMKNVSESLAGRAGIIKMLGLSMREIDGCQNSEPFIPSRTVMETPKLVGAMDFTDIVNRVHKGFFPELYESESDLKDWTDFYTSYLQTYIEKDIRDVIKIQDESAFIKFISGVASMTGQLLNYSTLAEICGKDEKTVKAWLSVLESNGLVYLLQPYHNNYKKRLIKTPKLHFLDTGLACWLLGWNTPEQLVKGAAWGNIFESFVFAEILKSYYNDGLARPPLYYYRDKDKNEIDLLIVYGDSIHPIEIKTTSTPTKSMIKAFLRLEDIPNMTVELGAVICFAIEAFPLTDKVITLPVQMI